MNILDDALQGFSFRAGHMQIRKQRNKKMGFAHKTNFSYIHVPKQSKKDGFYILHLMIYFNRITKSFALTTEMMIISTSG